MRRAALILTCALTLAGCSAAGNQAPLHQAQKINTVTGDISTACGLLAQLTAFPPPPRRDLLTLQASAAASVKQLAAIDRSHPGWRFDGVAMRTIVNQARTMLRSCGLKSAATQLRQQTS